MKGCLNLHTIPRRGARALPNSRYFAVAPMRHQEDHPMKAIVAHTAGSRVGPEMDSTLQSVAVTLQQAALQVATPPVEYMLRPTVLRVRMAMVPAGIKGEVVECRLALPLVCAPVEEKCTAANLPLAMLACPQVLKMKQRPA
mmetsp:Transcript_10544/g.19113  ORF Transcript_10544/g.19113 Transcript_10544/m.19113 type:complete len:142 (+) Transcript_10544:79-504(+)